MHSVSISAHTHTHAQPTHSCFYPPIAPPAPTSLHFALSLALSFTFLLSGPLSPSLQSHPPPLPPRLPTSRLSVPLTSSLTMRSIYLSVNPPLLFPFHSLSRSVDSSLTFLPITTTTTNTSLPFQFLCSASSGLLGSDLLRFWTENHYLSLFIYPSISLLTCHHLFLVCSRERRHLPTYLPPHQSLRFCHCTHISFEVCAAPVTRVVLHSA